jgi:hypothetical protein
MGTTPSGILHEIFIVRGGFIKWRGVKTVSEVTKVEPFTTNGDNRILSANSDLTA